MNSTKFKQQISSYFGPMSKEHIKARELVDKSEKWDKYQYEKFGPPGLHKNETSTRRASPLRETNCAADDLGGQRQQQKSSWLPNDREIFRVTWSYLFARAGWIFMAYIMMFGFLGLLFLGMYMAVR
tara:strand:- start:650 stop:1030 length:381 start_codon:yes stop_codon:yes gene_type:complete